jgi:hypothetical protein
MAYLKPGFRELSEDDIAAIIGIGRKQAELMDELQAALEASENLAALGIARRMVGLEKKVRQQ